MCQKTTGKIPARDKVSTEKAMLNAYVLNAYAMCLGVQEGKESTGKTQ